MATLVQMVRFRWLADQLNDNEFKTFINEMLHKCGRNVVLTQFMDFKALATNGQTMDKFIEIVQGIILNRKKQPLECVPTRLGSLATSLIGEIGSYLNQKDYRKFAQCSRAIFIGTNSPNTLQVLDLKNVDDYASFKIDNYPQLYCLKVTLSKFKDLVLLFCQSKLKVSSHDRSVLPRLTHMEIDNEGKADANIDWLIIRWDNIAHLTLRNFAERDEDSDKLSKQNLIKLLSRFPKLTFLTMVYVFTEECGADDDSTWNRLLSDLQTFVHARTTPSLSDSIIRSRAHQLICVTLSRSNGGLSNDLDLRSLVEIECRYPLKDVVMSLVRKSRNLERASVDVRWSRETDDSLKLIADVISQNKRLDQVAVITPISRLEDVVSELERGIFLIRRREKSSIQIKLLIVRDTVLNASDILFQITRIINRLYISDISDYLVMFQFVGVCARNLPNPEQWYETIQTFAVRNGSKFDVSFSSKNIVISKKDSGIGGCIRNYLFDDWLLYK